MFCLGSTARGKSHAGGVTRPGAKVVTSGYSRNAAPRSPHRRPEAARNPSGDGHLRSSALSFVGGDHPDRHPPHSAPSDRSSLPRFFLRTTGLLPRAAEVDDEGRTGVIGIVRFSPVQGVLDWQAPLVRLALRRGDPSAEQPRYEALVASEERALLYELVHTTAPFSLPQVARVHVYAILRRTLGVSRCRERGTLVLRWYSPDRSSHCLSLTGNAVASQDSLSSSHSMGFLLPCSPKRPQGGVLTRSESSS